MEKTFLLDKETAVIFKGLCPIDPGKYIDKGSIAYGTIIDRVPVGLIIASVSEFTIFIDWLCIKDEYRGERRGMELVYILMEGVYGFSGDRCLHVECGEAYRNYFTLGGFEFLNDDRVKTFTSTLEDMAEIPMPKADECVKSIEMLTKAERELISNTLWSDPDIPLGLEFPIVWEDYMPQSYVRIKDEKLLSMLFLKDVNNAINIEYAYTSGGSYKSLFSLVSVAMEEILDIYEDDTVITATALNDKAATLFLHLFPNAEESYICHGTYYMV